MYRPRDDRPLTGNDIKLPKLPPLNTRESFLDEDSPTDSTSSDMYSNREPSIKPASTSPSRVLENRSAFLPSGIQLPTIARHRRPPPPLSISNPTSSKHIHKDQQHSTAIITNDDSIRHPQLPSLDSTYHEIETSWAPPSLNMRNFTGLSRVSDSIDSYYSDSNYTFNNSTVRHSSYNSLLGGKPLDLVPSITTPTQPFVLELLDENKLYQCYTIYKLSDIYEWCLKVYFEWFNEFIFGKFEFYQLIQRLLEFQLPNNFDQDTIDSNVDKIILSLAAQNAVRFEKNDLEESEDLQLVTIIVAGLDIQGIFTDLLPCYSFDELDNNIKCYSFNCISKLNTSNKKENDVAIPDIFNKSIGVWAEYWHLTQEELADINPREIQRQSFIFDLIILEERSLNMANAAIEIYGKRFKTDLLPDDPDFFDKAFSIFSPLIELHKNFLLNPLFWKIKSKGKFIDGIGKIYLKWCNEAKDIYLEYAQSMATVHEIITWEKSHKTLFAKWLNDIDTCPEITKTKLYHDVIFFGGFFKSLQNLPVTLNSVLKNTDPSMEDYEYLKMAIKEVENLSCQVDKVHGTVTDHRQLIRFSRQLVISGHSSINNVAYVNLSRSTMHENGSQSNKSDKLNLGLEKLERRLIMTGELKKKRELWPDPNPLFVALLDNYLLITESVVKNEKLLYKLVERPIPVEYLSLEIKKKQDQPPFRNRDSGIFDSARQSTYQIFGPTTNTSKLHMLNSAVSRTIYSSDRESKRSTKIFNEDPNEHELSFKIRNTATNESFTFVAPNINEKFLWIDSLILTFQNNKSKMHNIIRLNVLSTRFAYSDKDAPNNLPIALSGSEVDTALKQYDSRNKDNFQFPLVTSIFASTIINYEGKEFLLIACDDGILVRLENGRDEEFINVINCTSVTMMDYNHKLGLLFVLDNKNLIYFSIASIFGAVYDYQKFLRNNLIVGIVIRDKVSCFKFAEDFGNSKHLIFERKNKIFVLTPEFNQLTKTLKFFKDYKEYKLPASLISNQASVEKIIVLKKSFIICTTHGALLYMYEFNDSGIPLPTLTHEDDVVTDHGKGFDLASTNRSNEMSKHNITEYVKADIAANRTQPISCFPLFDRKEYLIVYDEAVIKINRYGSLANHENDVLVLDFCCISAAIFQGYLVLLSDNLIQIYDMEEMVNKPLKECMPIQIIKSKKIQLLTTNMNDSEVIIVLSHPNVANRQLILQFTIPE